MHKKVHQNIIFKVTKVKRKNLNEEQQANISDEDGQPLNLTEEFNIT